MLRLVSDVAILGLQQHGWSRAPTTIVVHMDRTHFADSTREIIDARFIDASQRRLGCAVTTSISAHLHSLQVHSESIECHVAHFHGEAISFRPSGLLKGDTTTECGFKSTTDAAFDVIDHEGLEQSVHFVPNRARYVEVRPAVQRGSAIVRIEEIDAKAGYRERRRLAARRGISD